MSFWILCLFLGLAPFGLLPLFAWISDTVSTGAGAAIPGVFAGLVSFVICWSALIGVIITKLFL